MKRPKDKGTPDKANRRGASRLAAVQALYQMDIGGAGVLEVVEDDAGGTYRAVYTVKFEEAVFVLHCFQKKSKRGIATPKEDMDIIRARLKVAEVLAKELRNGKTNH